MQASSSTASVCQHSTFTQHTTQHNTSLTHSPEWSFGGADSDQTGVFACVPRHAEGATYRETLDMGVSPRSARDVDRILAFLRDKYRANTYNLLSNNCITFADELCHLLTGKHVPQWLNRLATIGSAFSMFLPDSLTGGAAQLAQQQERRAHSALVAPPVPPLAFSGAGHTTGDPAQQQPQQPQQPHQETPDEAAARRERVREAALRRAQQGKQQQQQQQQEEGSESGTSLSQAC